MLFHAASNASSMLIGRLVLAQFPKPWTGLQTCGVAALAVIVLTRGQLANDPETMPEVEVSS